MKIENAIGWCDETTNAVTGCDKVSPGCAHCYAQVGTRARVLRAQGIETWGSTGVRHPVAQFAQKLRRLNKLCVCDKCHDAMPVHFLEHSDWSCRTCFNEVRRIRLFADSNSDWLDKKWALATLANCLNEIRLALNVDVLLLTKRIQDFRARMIAVMKHIEDSGSEFEAALHLWLLDWVTGEKIPANVWLGVSVENQQYADERIPLLEKIPAAVRFLSCEPLLGTVNLDNYLLPSVEDVQAIYRVETPTYPRIHWVIVGGESGKDRRPCEVTDIVCVAMDCRAAGVPVYVKQDCAFKGGQQGRIPAEIWGLKQFPVRHFNHGLTRINTDLNEESRKA